jgi:hypothetical protein
MEHRHRHHHHPKEKTAEKNPLQVSADTQDKILALGNLLKQEPLGGKGLPAPAGNKDQEEDKNGERKASKKSEDGRPKSGDKLGRKSKIDGSRKKSGGTGSSVASSPEGSDDDELEEKPPSPPPVQIVEEVKGPETPPKTSEDTPPPVPPPVDVAKKARIEQKASQAAKLIEHQSKSFVPTNQLARMLKTSMRFVPGQNSSPNVTGEPTDPPYLFKVSLCTLSVFFSCFVPIGYICQPITLSKQ